MGNAYILTPPECRFGKLIGCIKSGNLEYLVIYGTVHISDYEELREIADSLPEDQTFPEVYLQSTGGSLGAAYSIGRLFRRHSVTVRSGNPITGDRYSKCSSACMLIAEGATKRYLVHVGIHSPSSYTEEDGYKDVPAAEYVRLEQYQKDMNMDPRLFMMMRATKGADLLDLEYNPNQRGSDQYMVQFGFYQGETIDENRDEPSPVRYTNFITGRANMVLAAINGSHIALSRLIEEYTYGTKDIEPDPLRARTWMKIGIDFGDALSMQSMADLLKKEKKLAEAMKLYKRAAELGMAGAQNSYGWHLYKGLGIKRNTSEALYWIARSADQGEPFAYGSLCEIYSAGNVLSRDDIEAMKWCRLANDKMPFGKARDKAVIYLSKLADRMNYQQVKEANMRVDAWQPLKQTLHLLKDSDDNSRIKAKRYF